jgi:hypothetical protein
MTPIGLILLGCITGLIFFAFLWVIEFKPFARLLIRFFCIGYSDQYCEECGMQKVITRITDSYTKDEGLPIYKDKIQCVFDHGWDSADFSDEYILIDGKRKPYISPDMQQLAERFVDFNLSSIHHETEFSNDFVSDCTDLPLQSKRNSY